MIASSPTIENAMCAELAELNDITQTSLMDDFTTASRGAARMVVEALIDGLRHHDDRLHAHLLPERNAHPSREVSNVVTNVNV